MNRLDGEHYWRTLGLGVLVGVYLSAAFVNLVRW